MRKLCFFLAICSLLVLVGCSAKVSEPPQQTVNTYTVDRLEAKPETAKTAAKSVICSSLLKAAMFGADANWGRVICAIGYSGAAVDVTKIDISFRSAAGEVMVCEQGSALNFSEEKAKEILLKDEIEILTDLHDGTCEAVAWGCDLTYDYVKINGDYRT